MLRMGTLIAVFFNDFDYDRRPNGDVVPVSTHKQNNTILHFRSVDISCSYYHNRMPE